jgi:hypothetical protein
MSSIGVSKSISSEELKGRAIKLIAAFTGQSHAFLEKKSLDELFVILAHLMQLERKKVEELLRSHDQTHEIDEAAFTSMWRLINKDVVKKKSKSFGSISDEVFRNIKFLMALIGDLARFRLDNNLGVASSTINDPNYSKTKPAIVNPDAFKDWQRFKISGRAANGNAIDPAKF